MQQQIKQLTAADQLVQQHLKTFDTLDYTVFSNQEWERFHESHGKDIKVYWPDGHITVGLPKHIEDMKALFVHRFTAGKREYGSGSSPNCLMELLSASFKAC